MTVKQIQTLILWLRKEQISYQSLSAGGVIIDGVVDGKLDRGAATKLEPKLSMYERYGQELLEKSPAKPSEAVPEEAMLDA